MEESCKYDADQRKLHSKENILSFQVKLVSDYRLEVRTQLSSACTVAEVVSDS